MLSAGYLPLQLETLSCTFPGPREQQQRGPERGGGIHPQTNVTRRQGRQEGWKCEDTCWTLRHRAVHIGPLSLSETSSGEQRQTFLLPGFKPMRDILLCSAVQSEGGAGGGAGELTRMPGARSIIPSSRFHCCSLTEEKTLGPWGSPGPARNPAAALTLPLDRFLQLSALFFLRWLQHHVCTFAPFAFAPALTPRTAERTVALLLLFPS